MKLRKQYALRQGDAVGAMPPTSARGGLLAVR